MIVDCHAHFAPEVMFAKLAKVNAKFPNIELLSQDAVSYTHLTLPTNREV